MVNKQRQHKRQFRSSHYSKMRGQSKIINPNFKKPFKPMPKNVFHLPLETAVLVPSTEVDKKISQKEFQHRILETRKKLSQLFGGYTSVQAIGGYISDKKGLIEEKVVKVVSFAQNKAYLKNRESLKNWLFEKKKAWKQESIGYEFEGDLFYI